MNTLGRQSAPQHQPPIEHKCHEVADGFKHLQAHVSTNAYASQQEGEAPKCHPNTRVAVLDTILAWVLLAVDRISYIMWIFGPAGAGKSAIARSVVDLCLEQDVVIARFFFYRTDGTRNTLDNVVATLAFQLMDRVPELHPIITSKINANSLIFNYSFEEQLRILIFEPLRELHLNHPITKMILLLFDGVDECQGDQALLIRLLHRFIATKSVPVIALFLSRPEQQIKAQFQSRRICGDVRNLALDNNYKPDKDIRTYLDDIFAEIKESHPFAHLLSSDWPSEEALKTIVAKSSGQFVFASVAVAYISDPRSNPATRLEIILGVRAAPGNHEPFAQLDALYRHIFSQVVDISLVVSILATFVLQSKTYYLRDCAELHSTSEEDIEIALADLTSVVEIKISGPYPLQILSFTHASLSDFLLDPSRSGPYYIDRNEWSTRLALLYLTQKPCPRNWLICDFIKDAVPGDVLKDAVINSYHDDPFHCTEYLNILKTLDFGDGCGGQVYKQKVLDFGLSSKIDYHNFDIILFDHDILLSKHLIRQFWRKTFAEIKQNHPFRCLLPDSWPENDTLEQLITQSPGQLSHAFIAAGDIAMPRRHPALQLQPYISGALLNGDALFMHILSQVSDLDSTQCILSIIFLNSCGPNSRDYYVSGVSELAARSNISKEKLLCMIGELSCLVTFDAEVPWFYSIRPGFRDFLFDQTRSLHYYIDLPLWATRILISVVTNNRSYSWTLEELTLFIARAAANPTAEENNFTNVVKLDSWRLSYYLSELQKMDFGDEGEGCRALLDLAVHVIQQEEAPPRSLSWTDSDSDSFHTADDSDREE